MITGPTILLGCAALLTLTLGFETWRLTSSKAVRMNTFIGTAGLACAAYGASKPGGAQTAAVIAFFIAMIFGGRAIGIYLRSRKDADLRLPSNMMFVIAGMSLLAAVAVFFWR